MTDILIQPNADADDELSNGVVINDATLPLSNQSASALGLTLGTTYKARVLGAPETFSVSDVPAQMSAPSLAVDGPTQITATLASAPSDNGSAITSYDLRYSTDEANWTLVEDISSPHAITGLDPATLYYVQTRAVNANGPASSWSASASDTTSAALATLSSPTVTENAGDIDVGVTSDTAGGTIYFGARLSTSPQLSASDIINTTGDCLATVTDGTPTADGNNSATFLNPSNGTYVVDVVQVTSGNSNIVSSATVVVDETPPVLQTAATAGANTIELAYDETLAGSVTLTEMPVTINGTPENPTNAVVSGNTVTLTIATTLAGGETITLDYTRSTSTLADANGNFAPDIVAQAVTNNVGSSETVTALFVADQDTDGVVDLTYTISGDSNVSGVVTTSAMSPSAAQINAQQDHLGNPADSSFTNDFWTTGGSDTLPNITAGLPANTYYLHVVPAGGGDGEVFTSNGFALETEAPTLQTAATDINGTLITLTYSETLKVGSEPLTTDYAISGAANSPSVSSVTISGADVLLNLTTAILNGETITLDYTGTNLEDTVANKAATFSAQAVTNNVPGAFTEPAVIVGGNAWLTVDTVATPLPTDLTARLFFLSLTNDVSKSGRAAGFSSDGLNEPVYVHDSGDGINAAFKCTFGTPAGVSDYTVPNGDRYHALIAEWVSDVDGNHNALLWMWDATSGAWSARDSGTGTGGGLGINKISWGADPLRIFNRSDGTNHAFLGIANRMFILGDNSDTGNPWDLTDPSFHALFTDASAGHASLVSGATARTALGTPLIDLDGDASSYNNAIHNGSLTLVKGGAGSFS